jgi:alpha-L-fucosidase 2
MTFPSTLIALTLFLTPNVRAENTELVLWYDEPAEQWLGALVLGNGRVGAMVFGDLEEGKSNQS